MQSVMQDSSGRGRGARRGVMGRLASSHRLSINFFRCCLTMIDRVKVSLIKMSARLGNGLLFVPRHLAESRCQRDSVFQQLAIGRSWARWKTVPAIHQGCQDASPPRSVLPLFTTSSRVPLTGACSAVTQDFSTDPGRFSAPALLSVHTSRSS